MIPKLLSRLLSKPAPSAADPSDPPPKTNPPAPANARGSRSPRGRANRSLAASPIFRKGRKSRVVEEADMLTALLEEIEAVAAETQPAQA